MLHEHPAFANNSSQKTTFAGLANSGHNPSGREDFRIVHWAGPILGTRGRASDTLAPDQLYIERIQVEEGFLGGLDLAFCPGLNVLIGPRGAGKTSVIELIRFALALRGITERGGAVGIAHARSILEGGQVTVTLRDGERTVTAIRAADEDAPRISGPFRTPTVLSQNEIESIGVSAQGRLRLLDAFREEFQDRSARVDQLRGAVRESAVGIRQMNAQLEQIEEQIRVLRVEADLLEGKRAEYEQQLTLVAAAGEKQALLETLSADASRLSVSLGALDRGEIRLREWQEALSAAIQKLPTLDAWPTTAGENDELAPVREQVRVSGELVRSAIKGVSNAVDDIAVSRNSAQARRIVVDTQLREVRAELEALQKGSGALARRIAEMQEKAGEIVALTEYATQLRARRDQALAERDQLLDRLDDLLGETFQVRQRLAEALTESMSRRVVVSVTRNGGSAAYREALAAALKGSGLRQAELVPLIADKISPRELVALVEARSPQQLAAALGLTLDRTSRLLAALESGGVENVLTCETEDAVSLQLLDGMDYKDSEQLSTGQRCTAVLPLLLARPGGALVIDQPEDHLDNAFVVDVAVSALRRRSEAAQYIFSTHNPNIPVLGGADRVVLLGSDGRRGFVKSSGDLNQQESVQAITSVMEGGFEAFQRRSEFYASSGR